MRTTPAETQPNGSAPLPRLRIKRPRHFTMRVSAEEESRLLVIAEHHGLTASDALRWLVKREADAIVRERELQAARAARARPKGASRR